MLQLPLSARDYVMALGDVFVDAREHLDVTARYINDAHGTSNVNNCRFEPRGTQADVVATELVSAGDELFASYGEAYWAARSRPSQESSVRTCVVSGLSLIHISEPTRPY
eukprot:TRINITY_DN17442_c0_g1_i1.p1 TRINITY_DN17442_c0_g1~~TRINITY_DN17442_c0_g1_i1.p1  ORF type:complete len:110 (+),score=29.21 TRINITY_DN17442_c0_g1_i1:292-621(+)